MRSIRVIAGFLIVIGGTLCVARIALAQDEAPRKSEPTAPQSAPAAARSDREVELEKKVEELEREVLALRRINVELTAREMACRQRITELERRLAQRPVVRIQPQDQPAIVQPPAPKGAIRREFNCEPFYLIPLE